MGAVAGLVFPVSVPCRDTIPTMKTFSNVAFLSCLLAVCYGTQNFLIRDCSNNDDVLELTADSKVEPHPVPIPGTIKVSGTAMFHRNVSSVGPIDPLVNIQRYVGFLWVTIPCVSDVGSCRYKLCDKLTEAYGTAGCPKELTDNGLLGCECGTIAAGNYSLNEQAFTIPELSGALTFLASGDYKVKL